MYVLRPQTPYWPTHDDLKALCCAIDFGSDWPHVKVTWLEGGQALSSVTQKRLTLRSPNLVDQVMFALCVCVCVW